MFHKSSHMLKREEVEVWKRSGERDKLGIRRRHGRGQGRRMEEEAWEGEG